MGLAADPALNLPKDVIHAARRALVDHVAVAAAGSRHPAVLAVLGMMEDLGIGGACHIFGSTLTVDALSAAFANGTASHVLDWDDTILPTRIHLGATLFPPLLALGERLDLGVDEILPAFAVGFELQQRICLAIFPSVHDRRWHNTAIVGAIGAAAACGRLLRLPPHTIAHAVGIAANSAGGFASSYGTMSKSVNIGRAAARGLESAWLAQRGVQSHPDTLGEGGFLQMFDAAPRAIDTGFGDDWHLLRNGLKPYPCGVVAHGAVDAARALRDRYPDPQRVAVRVSPAAVQLMGNVAPRNELEAKFSLPYVVAATWIAGELGPESFAADALADPRIRALMNRIEIIADPGMTQSEALLHVEDAGSVTQLHLPHARGSLERPLSDADLLLKCDTGLRIAGIPARQLGRQLLNGSIPIRSMMTILSGGGSLPS